MSPFLVFVGCSNLSQRWWLWGVTLPTLGPSQHQLLSEESQLDKTKINWSVKLYWPSMSHSNFECCLPSSPHVPIERSTLCLGSSWGFDAKPRWNSHCELLVIPHLRAGGVGWEVSESVPRAWLTGSNAAGTPVPCFFLPTRRFELFVFKTGTPGESTWPCQWRWRFPFMSVIWGPHLGSHSSLVAAGGDCSRMGPVIFIFILFIMVIIIIF